MAKNQAASNPSSLILSPLSQDLHTCDVLAEFVVVLLQRLYQLRDAALLDQRYLVVHVLVDEVAGGAGGKALHLLVLAVEELYQLADALQATHLQISTNRTWLSENSLPLLC